MTLALQNLLNCSIKRGSIGKKEVYKKVRGRNYSLVTSISKKPFKSDIPHLETLVSSYLYTLKRVDISKMHPTILSPLDPNFSIETKKANKLFKFFYTKTNSEISEELLAVLSCAFVHPLSYQKFGILNKWNDKESIRDCLDLKKPLIKEGGISVLKEQIKNQIPFIQKIKELDCEIDVYKALSRYREFIQLTYQYRSKFVIVPPLDVDIIWHCHMLNHNEYVNATIDFFGEILDHDDHPKSPLQIKEGIQRTQEVWKKHFPQSEFGVKETSSSNDFVCGPSLSEKEREEMHSYQPKISENDEIELSEDVDDSDSGSSDD